MRQGGRLWNKLFTASGALCAEAFRKTENTTRRIIMEVCAPSLLTTKSFLPYCLFLRLCRADNIPPGIAVRAPHTEPVNSCLLSANEPFPLCERSSNSEQKHHSLISLKENTVSRKGSSFPVLLKTSSQKEDYGSSFFFSYFNNEGFLFIYYFNAQPHGFCFVF